MPRVRERAHHQDQLRNGVPPAEFAGHTSEWAGTLRDGHWLDGPHRFECASLEWQDRGTVVSHSLRKYHHLIEYFAYSF